MNLQKVNELSNRTPQRAAALHKVGVGKFKTFYSPTVTAINPDFLSGRSHRLSARTGFRESPIRVLNG